MTQPFSIVCLSSQEWDTPLPTNRQQIMSRAAGRGHAVLFVETGDFLGRHLWRLVRGPGRRSLLRRLLAGEQVAPGVRVQKLLGVAPWGMRYARSNELNWRLGALLLRRAARRLPPPRVLWIYDPRGAAAIGSFGEAFAVYDCVDDYAEQAGPDPLRRALVAAADRAAAARSQLVFTTTSSLRDRHERLARRVELVPNVAEFDHFAVAADRSIADPALASLPRPVLGFAGNFLPTKVDFDLLDALAAAFADATLLLAGPAHGEARARLEGLVAARPNVRWVGLRPYEDLPRVVAAFDVALIPYLANDYTRSCFPLKLYEYLAAGKPVVVTGLPELAGLEPHVVVADGRGAAVAAVRDALARADEGREARVALAARNTWETRTERLLGLVSGELRS